MRLLELARLFKFHEAQISLGKGKHPSILPPVMSKIVGQTEIFNYGMTTGLRKKLFQVKPLFGRMVPSLSKITKRTSNNNAIAYWSQQTYALFYTQARTATTVLDMPNALHNQTRSP